MKKKMKLVRFEDHHAEMMKDPAFRKALDEPDEDVFLETAYRLVMLRRKAGLTQAQLAKKMKTSQQVVARLESLNYKGHSLASLQKVAQALQKKIKIQFV
jgi:ribosome-binding protein aMBF1 (putative translation factor)